jgi:putative endonuclease
VSRLPGVGAISERARLTHRALARQLTLSWAAILTMTLWSVYIVRCADGTLYTGIAIDVARRVEEHNSNNLLAASYTRARRPVVLAYQESAASRSAAAKREYQIKQMSRKQKQALVSRC